MNCSGCIYFESNDEKDDTYGECHRFPVLVHIRGDHWCGEFQSKAIRDSVKELFNFKK